MKPDIAVLYAPGTSCHEETCFAVDMAGGHADVVLLTDLIEGSVTLEKYQGLIIPGGFSWGNHISPGRVFAVHLVSLLADTVRGFMSSSRPVLGISNGYQVLMETGILPDRTFGVRKAALIQNSSARFESRWVSLVSKDVGSFWTSGFESRVLRMPVAHGDGRLVSNDLEHIKAAFLYVDSNNRPTESYPANPSGSPHGIAGICDPSGLVLGIMPHPERAILAHQGSTDGLRIFENMVDYCVKS
jgi:phosphoribosylformylglycinamidine synthase I